MTEQRLEDLTAAILQMAVSMPTKNDLNDFAKELKTSNEVDITKKTEEEDDKKTEIPVLSYSSLL